MKEQAADNCLPLTPYHLRLQFNVPVRFANELVPALDAIHALGVDRLPVRANRLLAELHASFGRRAVSLASIAVDASQHAIRPA